MVDRIRQLLHEKQLTPTQFADAIGVARPIISHILSGRNKPSLEVVQKILGAFTDLSMPWLLNGSGAMWGPATPVTSAPVALPETPVLPLPEASANAEDHFTGGGMGSAEESSVKPRRRQSEQPGGTTAPGALPFKRPAAALPVPNRFQVAGARAVAGAKATPDMPQGIADAVVDTPEPTPAAAPPVSAPESPRLAEKSDSPTPMAAEAAAFLLQPGKAIRRIVIFYQDGSFADYQPE